MSTLLGSSLFPMVVSFGKVVQHPSQFPLTHKVRGNQLLPALFGPEKRYVETWCSLIIHHPLLHTLCPSGDSALTPSTDVVVTNTVELVFFDHCL